jgi:predicted acetyltransferase
MTTPKFDIQRQITVEETTAADRERVEHLYQFYLYDFSEMLDFSVEANGLYDIGGDLDGCWETPSRYTYLLKVDGELAGMAVVDDYKANPEARSYEAPTADVAEFFVMRKFRRSGVGRYFAFTLFDRFPGAWSVRQVAENRGGIAFWRKIIDEYTGGAYQEREWQTSTRQGYGQYFEAPGLGKRQRHDILR